MAWGFGTWDGSGVYNNTGLQPVNVLGYVQIGDGVLDATYAFNVPAGNSLRFIVIPDSSQDGTGNNRRQIFVSGNSVVVQAAPNNVAGPDRFPTYPLYIIGYGV